VVVRDEETGENRLVLGGALVDGDSGEVVLRLGGTRVEAWYRTSEGDLRLVIRRDEGEGASAFRTRSLAAAGETKGGEAMSFAGEHRVECDVRTVTVYRTAAGRLLLFATGMQFEQQYGYGGDVYARPVSYIAGWDLGPAQVEELNVRSAVKHG
jgi:hypothetical protein